MKLVLDTNIVIDFLKEGTQAFDLMALIEQHECRVSIITKLELLKFPDIKVEEESLVLEFLELVPVMRLNEAVEKETVNISRKSSLKLPDAIIGATAIVNNAELVTNDTHFIGCKYPALNLWQPSVINK